jgi:hypothetical protein
MRGTIIKRGATYSVVLDLGRDDSGRRVRKWHSGYKTKEAERAQVELLARLDQGAYVEPSKLTVAAFLREHWLPSLRAQVRPGTWAEHHSKVEVHLAPAIGGVLLQRLTPGHLNALYADLLGRGLSARTVLHVHATIGGPWPTRPGGAWSPVMSPFSPLRLGPAGPSSKSGQRPSYGRSLPTWRPIASTPFGCWRALPGCAGGSSSASNGRTSTSAGPGSRCADRWSRSATRSS